MTGVLVFAYVAGCVGCLYVSAQVADAGWSSGRPEDIERYRRTFLELAACWTAGFAVLCGYQLL